MDQARSVPRNRDDRQPSIYRVGERVDVTIRGVEVVQVGIRQRDLIVRLSGDQESLDELRVPLCHHDVHVVHRVPADGPIRNGRIAAELRRLAALVEHAEGDLPQPMLSFYAGATTRPGTRSECIKTEVRRIAAALDLPEPTVKIETTMCPISAVTSGVVTIRASGWIAPPPATCPPCGQACSCAEGGVQ